MSVSQKKSLVLQSPSSAFGRNPVPTLLDIFIFLLPLNCLWERLNRLLMDPAGKQDGYYAVFCRVLVLAQPGITMQRGLVWTGRNSVLHEVPTP